MGILSWIVFGLIAGIIAKLLMPGGCITTMLLGVAGAFVGGFIYRLVTGTEALYFVFDLRSFAIAVLGAVVVLAVYRSSSEVERVGEARRRTFAARLLKRNNGLRRRSAQSPVCPHGDLAGRTQGL